jgi:glycosyltransferase involved in cell wall biosynthesis
MRIVMMAQFYPPIIGGMERHVKDLSESLVQRGHDVAVITIRQAGWQDDLKDYEQLNGVRIYRIKGTINRLANVLFQDQKRNYAPPFPDPELGLAIRRILAKEQPDVIHAHNWLVYSYLPLKARTKAPLVVTLHEYGLSCPKWTLIYDDQICSGPQFSKCINCLVGHYGTPKGLVTYFGQKVMSRLENALVDMYLPVSQAVAEGSQLVGTSIPYQVIPNFIPDDIPANHEDITDQLPDGEFMLFVGAFGQHKGVDVLLEAYSQVKTDMPLVMIGYEIPEFALEAQAIPPNTIILKHWSNPAVMEAWKRSSLALIPSNWHEPCPTVAMEAMVAGCAIVGTAVGGIPDIVQDGETGLLVPPADAPALAQAIQTLVDDPERRQRMSLLAQERVVRYQARTVVPAIEQVYQSLIDKKRNG